MDWKGNSLTPAGTARLHRLQVTTNCLRSTIGNPKAMTVSIGEIKAKVIQRQRSLIDLETVSYKVLIIK